MPDEVVRQEIRKGNLKVLQARDQLLNSMSSSAILSKFGEGKLDFHPTYKYDDRSDYYDTSPKKRIPAWCDRILFEKPV